MNYTFRANVFIQRGQCEICFFKSTKAIVDKTKQYRVYVPCLSEELYYYGAELINPFIVFSHGDNEVYEDYLPDYQI
jgi:hypothetical protein